MTGPDQNPQKRLPELSCLETDTGHTEQRLEKQKVYQGLSLSQNRKIAKHENEL